MRCPTCKSDMIVVEHNRIELDYCIDCHGVWFDCHELELLLISIGLENQKLFTPDMLTAPEVPSSEKQRKCPICSKKMRKNTIGQQPLILVDVCRQGDGIWFDGDEITRLIQQIVSSTPSKQDSQQRILGFLGEIFKAQT